MAYRIVSGLVSIAITGRLLQSNFTPLTKDIYESLDFSPDDGLNCFEDAYPQHKKLSYHTQSSFFL